MQTTKRRAPFRAATAIMSLFILLGGGWWFRDDIRKLLEPKPLSDVPAALSNDPLADKEYALKVLQFNNYENSFEYYVKKPFIIRHPSVKLNMDYAAVDLMQDPDKFEAWLEQEQPDILQLPLSLYSRLAADGKLKPLDPLIKQSKFDLSLFHKPVVDYLRLAGGDGSLYGLATDFSTMALYVNEDLFAARGIPLPEGPQTMDQILQLAARFQGTGVSGLETIDRSNKFGLIQLIGQTKGLQTMAGAEGSLKATVNSDAWKQVWNAVAAGYREGWISQAKPVAYGKNGSTMKDIAKQDPFSLNKTAMTIRPSYYYDNLELYEQSGAMKANWSAVPIRLAASATNQNNYLSVNTVYAVNAASTQADAAWEVLRFATSGEWKRNLDPALTAAANRLFANRSAMDESSSKHWEAFYETEADPEKAAAAAKLMSGKQASQAAAALYKLGEAAIEGILTQSQSVDAAVDELQAKLNAQLAASGKGEQP